jgi:ribose transport system substrate-binding protein
MKGVWALVVVVALVGAGCGSSNNKASSSDTSAKSTSSTTSAGSSKLAAFEAKVKADTEKATSADPAKPPTDGPKAAAGKSVFVIGCSFQAEGCARPSKAAAEAVKAIGWKATLIDTQSDPAKAANSVRQAISQKADGIIVNAFDGPALAAPLAAARKAGLKLVGMVATDPNNAYDIIMPDTLEPDGYLNGEMAYQLSGGNLKLLMFTGDEFGVVKQRVAGTERFINDCKAAGGKCEIVGKQDVLAAQLGTQVPAQAAALARKHPDFNVSYTPYDGAGTFIIQGLKQSGVDMSKSQMVGFDANAPNIDIIRKDGYEKSTIGFPLEWMGYQAVDNLNRMFNGQDPVKLNTLHKLLTKDNVPPKGAWEGDFPGFRDTFKTAWGK